MGIRFIIHFEFTLVEFGKIHFIPKICSSMLNFQNILKTNKKFPYFFYHTSNLTHKHVLKTTNFLKEKYEFLVILIVHLD